MALADDGVREAAKNSKLSKLGPNPNFDPVKFYGWKHLCQTDRKRGIRIKISARWGRGGKSESAKGDKCKGEKTHKACRDTSYNTVALSKSVRPPREVDLHFLAGGARSARPPREADRRFLGEGG